jgi:hypothetical protein
MLSPNVQDNPSKKRKGQEVENASVDENHEHNPNDISQPQTSQTAWVLIPFLLDSHSELHAIKKPSFEIMLALAPIAPAKIFQTGRDSGYISQINLQVAFGLNPKILKCVRLPLVTLPHTKRKFMRSRIESFVVGPSYTNLVNIATCDHTRFHTAGKYRSVVHRESKGGTPSLFYTVGVVSHSDLVTGSNSHQICVIPSDLSWTRIAAVMGMVFKQKKLGLSAFKGGISFSTLKRKENSTNPPMSSLGISTPSFSKAPMARSNVPLPYNCHGTIHHWYSK